MSIIARQPFKAPQSIYILPQMIPSDELGSICTYLIEVAKEAGSLIVQARPTALTTTSKKNSADIVTQTDLAVEKLIREHLKTRYPTFGFMGEESASSHEPGSTISSDEYDVPIFIVDPIDGTSNFVHGLPEVCVSIGLVMKRKPTVGVVYAPFRDELWSAVAGQGAFWQHSDDERKKLPLQCTPLRGLTDACIGIEWGSDREGPNFDLNLKVFTTLARTTRTGGKFVNSLRCIGSAALAICRVAAGQQEAFWECGCWVWDVAAAWCILSEAGGMMVDGHPGNWNPEVANRRYLAVRAATDGQRDFVEEFWSVLGDDRSTYGRGV